MMDMLIPLKIQMSDLCECGIRMDWTYASMRAGRIGWRGAAALQICLYIQDLIETLCLENTRDLNTNISELNLVKLQSTDKETRA